LLWQFAPPAATLKITAQKMAITAKRLFVVRIMRAIIAAKRFAENRAHKKRARSRWAKL
jgi:hypothetical protein